MGRAARHLVSVTLALKQLGAQIPATARAAIIQKLDAYVPLESTLVGQVEKMPDAQATAQVPSYFVSLRKELNRLQQAGSDGPSLRIFAVKRLREFLEICYEYEAGRAAIAKTAQYPVASEYSRLSVLADEIANTRADRKGQNNAGVAHWREVATQLGDIELASDLPLTLEKYQQVLLQMSGYTPTVVRVIARSSVETRYSATVETWGGRQFKIESQFPLHGAFAYLPPHFERSPSDRIFQANDLDKWTPSTTVRALFTLQAVELWNQDWSALGNEFESISLDFKEQLPKQRIEGRTGRLKEDFPKHLVAFANGDGGWLVIGILDPKRRSENKFVRGLTLTEAAEVLDIAVHSTFDRVTPPLAPPLLFRAYPEGGLVILCKIARSLIRPQAHYFENKIYVRAGTQSVPIDFEKWNALQASKEAI